MPQIQVKEEDGKRVVWNLETWMRAWSIFVELSAFYHPHLCYKMIVYQALIVRYSGLYDNFAWLSYDAMWKMHGFLARGSGVTF